MQRKKDDKMKIKIVLLTFFLLLTSCSRPTKLSIAKMHIVGVWHEADSSNESIGELIFRDDGTFSLTKTPFDVSKNYSGTYTIDPKKKRLHLEITDGKNIPKDAKIDNFHYSYSSSNELILTEGYFGTFTPKYLSKNSYIFQKGYQLKTNH